MLKGWILDAEGGLYDVHAEEVVSLFYQLLALDKRQLLFYYSRGRDDQSIDDVDLSRPRVVFARGADALVLHKKVEEAIRGEVGFDYSTVRASEARGFLVVSVSVKDADSENGKHFRRGQEKLAWNAFIQAALGTGAASRVALFSQTREGEVLEAISVRREESIDLAHEAYVLWDKHRKGLSSGRRGARRGRT